MNAVPPASEPIHIQLGLHTTIDGKNEIHTIISTTTLAAYWHVSAMLHIFHYLCTSNLDHGSLVTAAYWSSLIRSALYSMLTGSCPP